MVLVTGANSGIGFHTAKQLVALGSTVILGCRDVKKCQKAADEMMAPFANPASKQAKAVTIAQGGRAVVPSAEGLDLSSFSSVRAFADAVTSAHGVPDIIVNNAGFSPDSGSVTRTADGLEGAFGSMHVGHFLLTDTFLATKEEAPQRTKTVHVVNIASGMHRICLLKDCFDDSFLNAGLRHAYHGESYSRAKLSNVLHAWQIPRRYDMATAVSIDLGWVATSIQSWMKSGLLNPENLLMMRQAHVGVNCVLNAMDARNTLQAKGGIYSSLNRVGVPGQQDWMTRLLSVHSPDKLWDVSNRLWELSETIVKTKVQADVEL